MSIENQAIIVVGLYWDDIKDKFGGKHPYASEFDGMYGFRVVSPYYDADLEDSIIGFKVESAECYSAKEIDLTEISQKAEEQYNRFVETFGLKPKLFLSNYGS